ncbi:hypothetical protein GCM10010156_21270 [Planobispora rosea]|uniref:Antirestriction protein n=1 Tax=Planobispora rosea TaxID=35762 RepID=A0A8J3S000_PLARO|nr:hypothetical protein GCM10010156_21270 [Planobispora rosea]GIH84360.1 hypothetical protein Pro02_27680 [Planobispora rosea]
MTGEETAPVRPRIHAACLAAYSAGRSHGRWIDALQEPAEISAEIRAMLTASPVPEAEEWAIHDHQGFGDALVSESETVERVAAVGSAQSMVAECRWILAGVPRLSYRT